jgi:L-threonylcarbamoyladenylate synthase
MSGQPRTEITPTTYPRAIDQALRAFRQGRLVAFPTDTVYGVGALAFLPEAVEEIYRVKGRPLSKAIPLLLDGVDMLDQVAEEIPSEALLLAERFWPGPLTMVLPRRPDVPDAVTAGGPSVAVRVPDHEFALRLIGAAGGVLAATSANLSGHPDPVTAEEVLGYLKGRIDLILDGGPCPGGVPSTVVDLTGPSPRIVRAGALPSQELQEVIPGMGLGG